MRIGEAAAAAGMTAKTLRFSEQQGQLPPAHRCPGGYRDYPPGTVARLEFIRRSKLAGLTPTQIREVLRVRDAGQAPCAHVVAQLAQHLRDLEEQIAELTALRTSAAGFYQVAAEGGPGPVRRPTDLQLAVSPSPVCSWAGVIRRW